MRVRKWHRQKREKRIDGDRGNGREREGTRAERERGERQREGEDQRNTKRAGTVALHNCATDILATLPNDVEDRGTAASLPAKCLVVANDVYFQAIVYIYRDV